MTSLEPGKPIEILLVEDNPGDARLAQETIKGSEHLTNITIAKDGEVAMAMLRREGSYADIPRPNLILLDLRMPKKDGFEVLREVYEDSELRQIPVILLTGTTAESSVLAQYAIPPNRFWRKPITLERFDVAVRRLNSFGWKIGTSSFLGP